MQRILLVFISCWFLSSAAFARQPKIGELAAPFTITLFDKRKVSIEELRGKVVLINYWATWCGPCKAEMPMMNDFHRKAKSRGFEIFGVVTKDSVPQYRLKALSAALSYPLASGLKGEYGTIGEAVPSTYVIDRKGVLRYAKAGSFDAAEFAELINPLLAEAP
jgi:cytochrome c biogenesis protein CcmG, thiol:disulfide interchange protein DsbE